MSMRWRRRVIALVVLAALVSPALRDRDSVPLSTYPMYASARSDVVVLGTAVGIDDQGVVRRLSLSSISRSEDPLVAQSLVRTAIQNGDTATLCREIAPRVGDEIAEVAVVDERHDLERYAAGGASLIDRQVYAQCVVPR